MYIPTTLSELIEYGKSIELSHRNFNNRIFLHNVKSDEILKLPFNPIINKYRDFFGKHTVRLELTEEEQDRYWYHPKKLSYDYYGSVEYWSIILYINDAGSAIDFRPTKLNLVLKEDILELINEILIINSRE